MEEKKEKKTIKCSYAVLVIILFATVAFLTDYIIIDRKTRKCDCPKCEATNKEVISDNTDNTQVTENQTYSYEDIAGHYEYFVKGESGEWYDFIKHSLHLYEDGTFSLYLYDENLPEEFKFMHWNDLIGNYTLSGNILKLNYLYKVPNNGGIYSYINGSSIFEVKDGIITGSLNYSESKTKNFALNLVKNNDENEKIDSIRYFLENGTLENNYQ